MSNKNNLVSKYRDIVGAMPGCQIAETSSFGYSYPRFSSAPHLVRVLAASFDAFIVGGATKYLMNQTDECRDLDIIVPFTKWPDAQRLIPKEATHNTFGGSKIVDGEVIIDVWCTDLSRFLINNSSKEVYIVHPASLFSCCFNYGFQK
mgnify:CR=1 FL=1